MIDYTLMRDTYNQLWGFGFVHFENASSIDDIIDSKKDESTFTLNDHHIAVDEANAWGSRKGGFMLNDFCC